MYGLEAISAHNGWAVSVVGITIVFTGLVLLSIAINQIHKLLGLWENRGKTRVETVPTPEPEPVAQPISLTATQKDAIKQIRILAETLDEALPLPRLLNLAIVSGIDGPHTAITLLLKGGVLVPDPEGYFSWDNDAFDALLAS